VTALPEPQITHLYHLEATLGEPLDLGEVTGGRRRIVPLTGGQFTGPEIRGRLLSGTSADWQLLRPDGTSIGDIRYTLQTEDGALLYVRAQSIRHGDADVLARVARGEEVDASEYIFRAAAQIETSATELAWLNKGIFISVGGRSSDGVAYDTYVVE
jgi:Protein of unknown function (DUF3237)